MARAAPLPVVPRPLPDEHLVAWLWRVAGVYGVSASALLRQAWAGLGRSAPEGTLSHHPPPEALEILAECTRLPVEVLSGLALPRLRPMWGNTFLTPCTDDPRHAYCPACLAADENAGRPHHFRADWACALAFHCPVHDIDLHVSCPACDHTSFVFHGPPGRARLYCAQCRAQLGQKPRRLHAFRQQPGLWSSTDPNFPLQPLEEHGQRLIAFSNAAVTSLAGIAVDPAWVGSSCPLAFRSTLVGLLGVLSMPDRSRVGNEGRESLGQALRFPWRYASRRHVQLPGDVDLVPSFASLPTTTRFDLTVAIYAIVSGAEGLITLRGWRLTGEDWRLYHLADPAAQVLCAVQPDLIGEILKRAQGWGPKLAARFSSANDALRHAEVEIQRAAARLGGGMLRPITEASPSEQLRFFRRVVGRHDHEMLTIEELLGVCNGASAVPYEINVEELLDLPRSRTAISHGGAARGRQADRSEVAVDVERRSPRTPEVEGGGVPERSNQPNVYMAAARAALASEAGKRYRQTSREHQQRAWARLVREAEFQLERLRRQDHGERETAEPPACASARKSNQDKTGKPVR